MKKMQCEVCGSTDIKKIDDSIFECQSCGVQYDKNEVQKLLVELTGEVKIDRSEEIENTLKRAQQFLDEGDFSKASEYYNKVLDLDPNNEPAQQAINEINEKNASQRKKEQDEARRRSSAVKVLKHTIDPSEGVTYFLRALKNAPDVAPDIFKEIEIMSVTQGYYPFSVVDKQYSGTYDGIACYRKQVPYTDYETKTDYHNKNQDGSYKKVQVAVTKYREEIDRQKVNGSFLVDHFGIFSVSQKLNGTFTSIAPDKYDAALSSDKYFDEILGAELQRTHFNDVILQQIEKLITGSYNAIKSALTEVRTAEEKTIGEIEIFSGSSDANWENRITDLFASEVRSKAGDKVNSIIPGDFNEDVHYRWSEKYSNVQTIYLPIQTIEYAYRGKFYLAAMLLVKSNSVIHSYPCTTEVKSVESTAEKAITTAKRKPFPPLLITLYGIFIVGLIAAFWLGVVKEDGAQAIFWLIFGGVCGVPAIIWNMIWKARKNAAVKKEVIENTDTLDKVKTKYSLELANGAQEFFKVYTGLASVENAVAAAKKVSTYRTDISSIKGRTVFASVSSGKSVSTNNTGSAGPANIKDTNGQDLVDGCQYTIRMINSGTDKIEVCKIIRETCGIGLAAAKEIADTSRSVVAQGLSSSATDNFASKLKVAGAVIEIEKEM